MIEHPVYNLGCRYNYMEQCINILWPGIFTMIQIFKEETFAMQTPAARSQNLRRRRALTMDEIENIPPKPASSEDDVDIVEDSMLTEDTKEAPAEPPTSLSEQNDESILTPQEESLLEDSESTLKAERSNASKDQLNKVGENS
jgi:hypothetical protein